ncbi:MAG: hypothetical protein U1E27_11840 [Kiritimatiellia bacterium]|nr:hypothetical protein [Kiritimatiellia bacterium]
MKFHLLAALMTVLLGFGTSCGRRAPEEAVDPRDAIDADYVQLVDDLNSARQTELYVQEHWKEKAGTEITWRGKVVDVQSERGQAKVLVAKAEKPRYNGYNVILYATDRQQAGQLKKGEQIRFKGTLQKYSDKRGLVVIQVGSGELLAP